MLKMPDGNIITGMDLLIQFAEMAEKYQPISHYSSVYRGENNKFESSDQGYNVKTAINEELAETITAHILGFSFRADDDLGAKHPFHDRPEIERFVKNFLDASTN